MRVSATVEPRSGGTNVNCIAWNGQVTSDHISAYATHLPPLQYLCHC